MGVEIKISSKGQIVIPKGMRDALHLRAGETLHATREGQRIVLQRQARPARETISYEEFKRRVPPHKGPAATIEEMDAAVDRMFVERGRP